MITLNNKYLDQLLRLSRIVEDSFLVVLLTSMVGLAVTQILLRNFFENGISWADSLLRLLVLWVGLVGAMIATRQDHHISIDVLTRTLPIRLQLAVRVFVDVFTSLVSAIITFHAVRFVQMDYETASIAFADVPSWLCELIIPLAFGVIAFRYLIYAVVHTYQLLNGQNAP